MRDVRVAVEVEMRRSNGDYGWDQAMCQISGTLDSEEGLEDVQQLLLDQAARNVEGRLSRSASLEVRRTMLRKPRLCNHCGEPLSDDDRWELHPACDELQREERAKKRAEQEAHWEEERKARELVGVTAQDQEFADDQERDEDEDLAL